MSADIRHRLTLGSTRTECGIDVGRFAPDVPGGPDGTAPTAGGKFVLVTRHADTARLTCSRCRKAKA